MGLTKIGGNASYRKDIDGLRAVAVLAVVIFHFRAAWLSGGFAGVDVFFVISGYLISGHIFSSLSREQFSFSDFYRKRINRILPALFGVIAFTFVICAFFYLPPDFSKMAQSGVEALTYKANYYFAGDFDYFARSTAELPLLHLWSLSVEEQFYFVLPIFLFCLRGQQAQQVRLALGLAFVVSLGSAEYFLASGDTRSAYYSILPRASELLVGTFIATFPRGLQGRGLNEALGWTGLIGLALSFALFNEDTIFPGVSALLPCISAAFLILSGMNYSTTVSRLLSLRPVVFVGVISYSLYLYHWPLMAVQRYLQDSNELSLVQGGVSIGLAFAMAVLSWRYIEVPFRKSALTFSQVLKWRLLVPTALALGILFTVTVTSGLPQRYGARAKQVTESLKFLSSKYCHNHFDDNCRFGDPAAEPTTMLLGDSTAGQFKPMFDELGKKFNGAFVARSYDACFPLIQVGSEVPKMKLTAECRDQIHWAQKAVAPYKTVVLSGNWLGYAARPGFRSYLDYFAKSIDSLVAAKKSVVVLEEIPNCTGIVRYLRSEYSPLPTLFDAAKERAEILTECGVKSAQANQVVQALVEKHGATFFRLSTLLPKRLPFDGEESLYKDEYHLNEHGALTAAQLLEKEPAVLFREWNRKPRVN